MADQDFTTVRIGSKARGPGSGGVDRERVVKGKSAINAAQRAGAIIGTEKKFAGSNTKSSVDGQLLAKVDRTDDIVPPKTIDKELGKLILRRRNEMVPKMTQQDFANKCNIGRNVIADYENGKAIVDNAVLGKMQRVLGIKLTGTDIGSPAFGPKKK